MLIAIRGLSYGRPVIQTRAIASQSSPGPFPREVFGYFSSTRRTTTDKVPLTSKPSQRVMKIYPLSAQGKLEESRARLLLLDERVKVKMERERATPKLGLVGSGVAFSEEMSGWFFNTPGSKRTMYTTAALGGLKISSARGRTSVRNYSMTKEGKVSSLASEIPPNKAVDLGKIMEDLRDLELLDLLKGQVQKSGNSYKDAARCLYPLWHTLDSDTSKSKKVTVPFSEIQATLSPAYSLCWNVISEKLRTGKVARLNSLSPEDKASLLFLQIHGQVSLVPILRPRSDPRPNPSHRIGPRYAAKFVELGARTLAGLEKKCELTRAQKIGLKHIADINRLIPRSEMELLKAALEEALHKADPAFESQILGSYRRGVAFSSDIDLAIRHPSFLEGEDNATSKPLMLAVVDTLEKLGLINPDDQLTSGPKKFSGLIKLPDNAHFRRIDIRLAPYHSYPYMTLGSTGDALLMKLLRHTAKNKGWCLNEYGMGEKFEAHDQNPNGFQAGTLFVVKSEQEIFKKLGLPYLEPKDRDYTTWKRIYSEAGVDISRVEKL